MLSATAQRAQEAIGRMPHITDDERHGINRLAIAGQLAAAQCVERLILDRCTVVRVEIAPGVAPTITIAPPPASTGLWTSGATFKSVWRGLVRTDTWVADRFGCRVEWTVLEVRPS